MFEPSKELAEALNEQIGNELAASHHYLSIAAYFDGETLPELTKFFFRQSEEEREHALKFVHFLLEIGAPVKIPAVAEQKGAFASPEAAVQSALESENEVTAQIHELVELSRQDRHYAAQKFLDWFVTEQLEEVNTMQTLLDLIRRAGDSGMLQIEDFVARGGLDHGEED